MKKKIKNILPMILTFSMAVSMSACKSPSGEPEYYVPQKENVVDVTAPQISCSYNYKIVEVGKEFALPIVEFSENNVQATYTFDGQTVQPGVKITPMEVGTKVFEIKAQDSAGNKATPKKVCITVTDNISDLNKIYAIDIQEGIEAHLGTSRSGVNQLTVRLVQDGVERPKDMSGKEIPLITDAETGETISDSYVYLNNYSNTCRMVFNNPLHTNWDKNFEQIYFYFYHGGEQELTLNFNNYEQKIAPKSGWTKVIVAPKEVVVQGDNPETDILEESYTKVVTDYEYISSLTGSASLEGLFDLEDCHGAFMILKMGIQHEPMAISSIYGKPITEVKA